LKLDDLIRVGRIWDGGYVISESLMKQSSVLLSFGINDDWSFEKDFNTRSGVRCYCFDFSIHNKTFFKRGLEQIKFIIGDILKRRKLNWKRFRTAQHNFSLQIDFNNFFKKNVFLSLGLDKTSHGQFKSLDDILKVFFINKECIFLKADIEEYEFRIIDDILDHRNRFHSIAMEVHNIHNEQNGFRSFIEKLEQHFYIYHLHANNYGNIQKIDEFPNVLEISCIRKDLIKHPIFYKDFSHLPLNDLDFPNNPNGDDFKWQ
jgi:hypothetical protein